MTAREYKLMTAPSEDVEQMHVMEWCRRNSGAYPELEYIYHIPNEGKRSKAAAAVQMRIGLKAGVPDLCLPAARQGFHGLYIELKSLKGRLSPKQRIWLDALAEQGYKTVVCYGADEAIAAISDYIKST